MGRLPFRPVSGQNTQGILMRKETNNMWLILALLSAVFAALTSLLAKVGIEGVDSNVGTAIRMPCRTCTSMPG